MSKVIERGVKARRKVRSAVNLVGDIVRKTLGVSGRNGLYDRENMPPVLTNDGVSISREVESEDEIENVVIDLIVEGASKTEEYVGDGTSTYTVLTQKLINQTFDEIDEEGAVVDSAVNVVELRQKLQEGAKDVTRELESLAKPVKTKEVAINVATQSMQDDFYGEKIGEMMWKLGADGIIHVEESKAQESKFELLEGFRARTKLASPWLVTDRGKKEAVYSDPYILVTNQEFRTPEGMDYDPAIQDLLLQMRKHGIANLVLVGDTIDKPSIDALVSITLARNIPERILPIKAPAFTDEEKEDIAIYVGAKFVNVHKKMSVANITKGDLGTAEKVICRHDTDTVFINGGGDEKARKKRLKDLKAELAQEEDEVFQAILKRRISSVAAGIGLIKVGALTDGDRIYLKRKVDDAYLATKAALQDGVVAGAGQAYKAIAKKLGKNHILYEALHEPYNAIQENAGGQLTIPKEIVDPVKVCRVALENAVSTASGLITIDTIIAHKKPDIGEDLAKLLGKSDIFRYEREKHKEYNQNM